jgi:hypothetical protein
MTRAEECRHYSSKCLAFAQIAQNPEDRARLLEMAHAWNELAIKLAAENNQE